MDKLIKGVNNYSGLLTFLSVIIGGILYITNIQADVNTLTEDMKVQTAAIDNINESLRDKSRDHEEFSRRMLEMARVMSSIERVLIRLDVTLNNIEKNRGKYD